MYFPICFEQKPIALMVFSPYKCSQCHDSIFVQCENFRRSLDESKTSVSLLLNHDKNRQWNGPPTYPLILYRLVVNTAHQESHNMSALDLNRPICTHDLVSYWSWISLLLFLPFKWKGNHISITVKKDNGIRVDNHNSNDNENNDNSDDYGDDNDVTMMIIVTITLFIISITITILIMMTTIIMIMMITMTMVIIVYKNDYNDAANNDDDNVNDNKIISTITTTVMIIMVII